MTRAQVKKERPRSDSERSFIATILDAPVGRGNDVPWNRGHNASPHCAAVIPGCPRAIHHHLQGGQACQPKPRER
jgi:hypothetical protein